MGVVGVTAVQPSAWLIALLVLSSLCADISLLPLFTAHIYWTLNNVTTREESPKLSSPCDAKRSNTRNVSCKVTHYEVRDGISTPVHHRITVKLDLRIKPWKASYWANWTNVMGVNWWEWLLPISPTSPTKVAREWWKFEFNDSTKAQLRAAAKRMLNKENAHQGVVAGTETEENKTEDLSVFNSENNRARPLVRKPDMVYSVPKKFGRHVII